MAISILLVDDDPIARRAVEQIIATEPRLEVLEATVTHAMNPIKALAILKTTPADLVITELSVPGMDGFAFCREIRRMGEASPPIVVMSAVYKDPTIIANLLEELGAVFCGKPIQNEAMVEAILKALPPSARVSRPLGLTSDTLMALSPAVLAAVMPPKTDSQGLLSEQSAAQLLFEHIEAKSTGTLVLVRGQMRKEIFLREGQAVASDSNVREEALGSLLVAKRIIDETQLQYLLAETKRRGRKMGSVLVELGWMTPEDVLQYLAAQARKRIGDCLRWPDGTWGFVHGDTFSQRVMDHALDTPRVIFAGLFRTTTAEDLARRLAQDGARTIRLLPRLESFREAFEAVLGKGLLEPLEGITVGALAARSDGQMLAAAVDVLVASGLVALEDPPIEARAEIVEGSGVFSFKQLGSEVTGRYHALQTEMDDELTNPELTAFVYDEAMGPAAVTGELGKRDDRATIPVPVVGGATAPSGNNQLRTALLHEYLELHDRSLHQILGVTPEAKSGAIKRAYSEKLKRLSDPSLGEAPSIEPAKVEALRAAYERAFRVLSDPAQRKQYDAERNTGAPASETPSSDTLGAELLFREGLDLLERGEPDEAARKFDAAASARPDQAAYHAYLGWALFLSGGEKHATAARQCLGHALSLDPDLAKAHELFGRFASQSRDASTARRHLERALDLEPAQPELVELLISAFDKLEDPEGAERVYRRIIAALGDDLPGLRCRLWSVLADIYENRLDDVASARTAYEMAARLAPSELALQAKVVELNQNAPARWRETGRAMVALWQQSPGDVEMATRLVDLFLQAGQQDGATLVATAALLRGIDTEQIRDLAEQGRPRVLRRIPSRLEGATWKRIVFPGEDDDIEALVATLANAAVLPTTSAPATGEAIPAADLPGAFRRVLKYVADTLGASSPAIVRRDPTLGGDAQVVDERPYSLAVGPALLDSTDTVELGFRIGRALALSAPGRAAGARLTGSELRPYFVAALTVARGASAHPDPEADAIVKRMAKAPPPLRATIAEVGMRLSRRRAMDVSRWARALTRTATRVGLVLSADLLRVGNAVIEAEGAAGLDELLAFALSPEHFDLREELGISAVV